MDFPLAALMDEKMAARWVASSDNLKVALMAEM